VDLDIDNLKTIRFALAVHKDTIKPYVDVNVDGLLEDIDREISSLEPEKFASLIDVTGQYVKFDDDNKSLYDGSWFKTITYNAEWLEYMNQEDPGISYVKEFAYSKGDDYDFVKEQMDKAHEFANNLSDNQIEALILKESE